MEVLREEEPWTWRLWWTFVLLIIAHVLSTEIMLASMSIEKLNPLAIILLSQIPYLLGRWGFYIIQFLWMTTIALIHGPLHEKRPKASPALLLASIAIIGIMVAINIAGLVI